MGRRLPPGRPRVEQLPARFGTAIGPAVAAGATLAILGLILSLLTIRRLQHRLNADGPLFKHPGVRAMLRHNELAELIRTVAYILFAAVLWGWLFARVGVLSLAWGLTIGVGLFVANSLNEFVTAWRLERGGWRRRRR